MDEIKNEQAPEQPGYEPRPKWQVLLAWVGVAVMIVLVIIQVLELLSGFQL